MPSIQHIYFMGNGGISMSGLAHIMHASGYTVSGSDRQTNEQTQKLTQLGLHINTTQVPDNISQAIDLIVYTAAIHPDHPEYLRAQVLGIPMWSRAKLLGHIISHYRHAICIAGTHGKTTTTSMTAHLLMSLGITPTVSVGAHLPLIGGNFLLGDSDYFVVESCEYNDSFLAFKPQIGVILNLEFDHPDHFKDLADMEKSFQTFANNVKGFLIVNKNIHNYQAIVNNTNATVLTFGEKNADFSYDEVTAGHFTFNGHPYQLPVIGKHNVENATAALASLHAVGLDEKKASFDNYNNPKRRLELKGHTLSGALILDDYAHHPTEIRATLAAVKARYPDKTIHCLFQPHTFSRTLGLLNEFAVAFGDSETTYLLDIYGARETSGNIHTKDLQHLITNTQTKYFGSFQEAQDFFEKKLSKDDLLITMGATNVNTIGEFLIKK